MRSKDFRMIRRMNILFRISGEQSESCTIRQKSTSKTWKKKAITFSWIRNTKGTSTCMTQREIPLWWRWRHWDIRWIRLTKARSRKRITGWFNVYRPWSRRSLPMRSLITWHREGRHLVWSIPEMRHMWSMRMKTWDTTCRKAELISGPTPWSFRRMRRIRNLHMHLSIMQVIMTELMTIQVM